MPVLLQDKKKKTGIECDVHLSFCSADFFFTYSILYVKKKLSQYLLFFCLCPDTEDALGQGAGLTCLNFRTLGLGWGYRGATHGNGGPGLCSPERSGKVL